MESVHCSERPALCRSDGVAGCAACLLPQSDYQSTCREKNENTNAATTTLLLYRIY